VYALVEMGADGSFDPAHVESTPMPMINNAMASAHAACKAFAVAVWLPILILHFLKDVALDTWLSKMCGGKPRQARAD
jgi:hypothetical protein